MFYCIMCFFFSFFAELIQHLSLVFKVEIFDWSAGLLRDFVLFFFKFCP